MKEVSSPSSRTCVIRKKVLIYTCVPEIILLMCRLVLFWNLENRLFPVASSNCTSLTVLYHYMRGFEVCICFWLEFNCPEVTLSGWQDIKIQLLSNELTACKIHSVSCIVERGKFLLLFCCDVRLQITYFSYFTRIVTNMGSWLANWNVPHAYMCILSQHSVWTSF